MKTLQDGSFIVLEKFLTSCAVKTAYDFEQVEWAAHESIAWKYFQVPLNMNSKLNEIKWTETQPIDK